MQTSGSSLLSAIKNSPLLPRVLCPSMRKLQMAMKKLKAHAQWMEHCNGNAKRKVPDDLLICKDAKLYTGGFVLFVHDSQKDNGEANYSPSEHSLSEEMMANRLGFNLLD